MDANDSQLIIRVPRELRDKLAAMAEAEQRTLSNLVRVLLEKAIAGRKRKL